MRGSLCVLAVAVRGVVATDKVEAVTVSLMNATSRDRSNRYGSQ